MVNTLISELTCELLQKSAQRAKQDYDHLLSEPFLENVVKFGTDRRHSSRDPIFKANKNNSDGSKDACMIYTSLEGEARGRCITREKVINFMVSKYIIRNLLPEAARSVYVPSIIGHKVVYENQKKHLTNIEYYLSYEPRHLIFSTTNITPENYAKFLGRDIARFMYCGLNNVPRHVRPNFRNNKFRSCMIDMDVSDPRVFDWICKDLYPEVSTNYKALLMNEGYFFREVGDSFLNALLPDEVRTDDLIRSLESIYFHSYVEEIARLKRIDVLDRFKPLIQK